MDGSSCSEENWAGVKHGNSVNVREGLGLNSRGFVGNPNPYLNPNLTPLGSAHIQGVGNSTKGRDGCIDDLSSVWVAYGPMELVLVEKNDPITLSDGKK